MRERHTESLTTLLTEPEMAKNKTQPSAISVDDFIAGIADDTRRADCRQVVDLMTELSGEPPKMWGKSIIGFGQYHYQYDSGREGDFMRIGVSPRARELTLYIMPGFETYAGLLAQLGRHRTGKSCLYVPRLAQVDIDVLKTLISASLAAMAEKYPL